VVLHALEGDQPITGGLDPLAKDPEAVDLSEPVDGELVLQQALGRILRLRCTSRMQTERMPRSAMASSIINPAKKCDLPEPRPP
jgi:hypothetical protein